MGAPQQALMMVGGAAPFVGPLDSWTTNLQIAVSIDRLLTSYSSTVTRVATSAAGNAQTDIGTTGPGAYDSAALASAIGANSATIVEFKNQAATGSNYDVVQGTLASEPTIYSSGSYLGSVQFDGTNDGMGIVNNITGTTGVSIFLRGKLRSTSGTQTICELMGAFTLGNCFNASFDSGTFNLLVNMFSGGVSTGMVVSNYAGGAPNDDVQCWRFDRTQATKAAMTGLFVNGTLQTRSGNGDTGVVPSGSFETDRPFFGARGLSQSFPSTLNIHTLLYYTSALSDADVASISTLIAALP